MKRFNTSVARVKDQNGEFVPLDAIRGESIYDIAVRYGFVGSDEDLIREIMSNGWVAYCEQLAIEKADITYVDAELAKIYNQHTWKRIGYGVGTGKSTSDRFTITLDHDLRNYNEFYFIFGGKPTENETLSFRLISNGEEYVFASGLTFTQYIGGEATYHTTDVSPIYLDNTNAFFFTKDMDNVKTTALVIPDGPITEVSANNCARLEVMVVAR